MDAILTAEGILDGITSVKLDLDAGMVDAKVFAQYSLRLLQNTLLLAILIGVQNDVTGEANLLITQRPYMYFMNRADSGDFIETFLDLFRIDVIRHCLKNQKHALPESLSRSVQDYEGEKVGADRINEPEFRAEENNSGSNYDSN